MNDAAQIEFWRKLDALRNKPQRHDLAEIANLSIECGVSGRAALLAIQTFTQHHRTPNFKLSDTTERFLGTLCETVKFTSIVEYTCSPRVLAATQFEGRESKNHRLVAANSDLADLMGVLFNKSLVLTTLNDIDPKKRFDCVICQSSIGHHPGHKYADGFGGEVVRQFAPFVSNSGTLIWMTARGALSSSRAQKTFSALTKEDFHILSTIEIPARKSNETGIEGVLVLLGRDQISKKLVGILRDPEHIAPLVTALARGPSKKRGLCWDWVEKEGSDLYTQIETQDLLKKIAPLGRYDTVELASLTFGDRIIKANKPIPEESKATEFLYVPEYASSQVTVELEEQTVKPKAVYRVPIDGSIANPRFLATLLNGRYGRELRLLAASGMTVPRISIANLKKLRIPLPDLETQHQISHLESDLVLLVSRMDELKVSLSQEWSALANVTESVDELKAIFDVDRRIENWSRELPYPLATVYRRYIVEHEPKERLQRLLHFFEVSAIYLATLGISHVKALRLNWEEHLAKLLYPNASEGFDKASFGFWSRLAGASLKELNRIASNLELRDTGSNIAGPELINVAEALGQLSKTTPILAVAVRYRNTRVAHGGYLKTSDAERCVEELEDCVRQFYNAAAGLFRHHLLVRPSDAIARHDRFTHRIEVLRGSDPAFDQDNTDLKQIAPAGKLAFWMKNANVMCPAIPTFHLSASQDAPESCVYVYSRITKEGLQWVAYQEAREQQIVSPNTELDRLIALRNRLYDS